MLAKCPQDHIKMAVPKCRSSLLGAIMPLAPTRAVFIPSTVNWTRVSPTLLSSQVCFGWEWDEAVKAKWVY